MMNFFKNKIKKIILALTECLVQSPDSIKKEFNTKSYLEKVDLLIGDFPSFLRIGFYFGVIALNFLPLFFLKRGTLVSLKPQTRELFLLGLMTSKIAFFRDALCGVRAVILVCYFSDPSINRYLGYDPEAHVLNRKNLREKLLKETA